MAASSRAGMAGRPKGRPRTGVREAILKVAEELLMRDGPGRLSTAEIAKSAGVAESSIFYHFHDRVGLMHAIIVQYAPEFGAAVSPRETPETQVGEHDLRETLVVLMQTLESFFNRVTPIIAAMLADHRLRASFARRNTQFDGGPRHALSLVRPYLEAERAAGRVGAGRNLDAVALMVVGVAHEHAIHRCVSGPHGSPLPSYHEVAAVLVPYLEM